MRARLRCRSPRIAELMRALATRPRGATTQPPQTRARSAGLAGVGFVLTADDGIIGIDLDSCRNPETKALDAWAADVVALKETYAEVSPSGRGLRMLALATGDVASLHASNAGVEVYTKGGRFVTITGNHLPDTPDKIKAAPRTVAMLQDRVAKLSKAGPRERWRTAIHGMDWERHTFLSDQQRGAAEPPRLGADPPALGSPKRQGLSRHVRRFMPAASGRSQHYAARHQRLWCPRHGRRTER